MTARTGSDRVATRAIGFLVAAAFVGLACNVLNAMPASITTYAVDCVTPQTSFFLGDSVCAKADGIDGLRLQWVNPDGYAIAVAPITSDPATETFVLPATDQTPTDSVVLNNLGRWRVTAVTPGNSTRITAFFTVANPTTPKVDLSISKNMLGTSVPEAGSSVDFVVEIINQGPNDAVNAHFVDSVFTNASFNSLQQTGGPQFTCSGADCTVASFPNGAVATFVLSFTAGSAGGVLENTATISNDVADLNEGDNSSTSAAVQVAAAAGGTPATCYLLCPNNVVVSANPGSGGTNVVLPAVDVSGTCGTVTLSPASGSLFRTGVTTVNATSSTGGGACSFSVTVLETPPPAIACPSNITAAAISGAVSAFVPDPNVSSSDPGFPTATGSNVTVSGVRSDDEILSDPYPIGQTTIRWTAIDDGGRSAACTQRITVTSPDVATITCPANKTFSTNSCEITLSASDIGTPTSTGEGVTVTSRRSDDLDLTDPYPTGDTVITWTAANDISRASCTQTIRVAGNDTQPPVLTIPPDITTATSTCFVILDDELGVATASDDCGAVSVVRAGVPPNFAFPTGTTNITYTATDGAGNRSTAVQHVTVTESPAVRPTITAPPDVTAYTGAGATGCGTTVPNAALGTATASDNCLGVTVTTTGVPALNFFPVGETFVTYTATDASGNTSTATQSVKVIDNTPPSITCPANITLEPTCPTGAVGTWTAPSGSDNCSATTTQTNGLADGSVFPAGSTAISYKVTDAAGNQVSCSFSITVLTVPATIDALKAKISAANLNPPQAQGLLPKLDTVLTDLTGGNTKAACQHLSVFINSVQNFVRHGDIPEAQGQAWITTANHLMNALGCTNNPCS
jgi:hypothetical protein